MGVQRFGQWWKMQGRMAKGLSAKGFLGGLGILDLDKFSRALRLRWLWYEWVTPDEPWVCLETPNDQADRDLFNVATKVTIGNGLTTSFWTSSWMNGVSPKSIAPWIFEVSKHKKRSMHDALRNL